VGTSAPAADAPPTVLVIDDSATSRAELREALESAGYAVVTAETGEAGLRTAVTVRPRVVIVDGVLPGIDGGTVVRQIRLDVALRRTPCLLLTGSDSEGDELRALDAGADAYLRKDEGIAVILARVAALLRAASAAPAADATPSLLGPKKILAVDDSLTYLQEVAAQLRDEGYGVVLAHSGEEALELLCFEPIDGILLDLVMPGLSGHETCRRIKRAPEWRDIPLIILTAREEREAMIEGINAGADDYIAKSADFDVLKARLRAQLRRKQFEDENRSIREQLMRKEMEASEARSARQLAEARAALLLELEQRNEELEAFSYSVSHDLRAPLRGIDGFSQALLEDCADQLDEQGQQYLQRVRAATRQMGQLIDGLLALARVTKGEIYRQPVDLSELARSVLADLQRINPLRVCDCVVQDGLVANGDPRLLRVLLENLLGNAWKFTSKRDRSRIVVGSGCHRGRIVYFIRDNGEGFDMTYAKKLFSAFQRLHASNEFEGTGIGLATVERITRRHGGKIWARGRVGRGAIFCFTLGDQGAGGQ
jgi:DNA-binding response OmpR family regulator